MMVADDYEAMVQWHPEMILISETPVTWQGFLTNLCRANSGRNIRIKLKLIVPNYPSLCDADIRFGKEITLIRNAEFTQKVKDLMQKTTKVSSFLRQLQSLIGIFINNDLIENTTCNDIVTDNTAMETLQELKDALETSSGVQLLSDSSLNTIKMSLKKVSLKLQRTKHKGCPWTVVYSDLPEISALGPFEKNLSTLTIAKNKFKFQVEILEKVWELLKQIDEDCWVLDPVNPKPCHLYRRIYLTPALSVFIKVDPLNPTDLPEIKFMGSEVEVESKRDLVSKNLHNWNPKYTIKNNLMMLMNINAFPCKEEKTHAEDKNVVVADEECCICFSMELDNENLPDKICSNEKCRRHFHTSCLLQAEAVRTTHCGHSYTHEKRKAEEEERGSTEYYRGESLLFSVSPILGDALKTALPLLHECISPLPFTHQWLKEEREMLEQQWKARKYLKRSL